MFQSTLLLAKNRRPMGVSALPFSGHCRPAAALFMAAMCLVPAAQSAPIWLQSCDFETFQRAVPPGTTQCISPYQSANGLAVVMDASQELDIATPLERAVRSSNEVASATRTSRSGPSPGSEGQTALGNAEGKQAVSPWGSYHGPLAMQLHWLLDSRLDNRQGLVGKPVAENADPIAEIDVNNTDYFSINAYRPDWETGTESGVYGVAESPANIDQYYAIIESLDSSQQQAPLVTEHGATAGGTTTTGSISNDNGSEETVSTGAPTPGPEPSTQASQEPNDNGTAGPTTEDAGGSAPISADSPAPLVSGTTQKSDNTVDTGDIPPSSGDAPDSIASDGTDSGNATLIAAAPGDSLLSDPLQDPTSQDSGEDVIVPVTDSGLVSVSFDEVIETATPEEQDQNAAVTSGTSAGTPHDSQTQPSPQLLATQSIQLSPVSARLQVPEMPTWSLLLLGALALKRRMNMRRG